MALYNGGHYLRMAVESVLAQTYRDFEFLIINDCSTDNSIEVIKSYNDNRIRIYRNEKNLGQTQSLNVGLREATGQYIARMDADDYVFPNWLELQVQSMETYPDFAVISANAIVIDENNKLRQNLFPSNSLDEIILNSTVRSPINHVGSIFDKEKIIRLGGYDVEYKISADYDLWSKLLRSGDKLYVTNEILMAIRIHQKSLSRSGEEKELIEIMSIMKKNIAYYSQESLNDREILDLANAYYSQENISEDNLSRAVQGVEKLVESLISKGKLNKDLLIRWGKKQVMILITKGILKSIQKGQITNVRKLASLGIAKMGVMSIFLFFYGFSFFGKKVLAGIPSFYKLVLRQKAKVCSSSNLKRKVFT